MVQEQIIFHCNHPSGTGNLITGMAGV